MAVRSSITLVVPSLTAEGSGAATVGVGDKRASSWPCSAARVVSGVAMVLCPLLCVRGG